MKLQKFLFVSTPKAHALSQSDFVMSKMAADIEHGGNILRKTVDYFCHLAVKPEFYSHITNDEEFQNSKYASKIKWLSKDYDDIFDPDYGDMLRVSFMHQFRRGKLSDLVSLLSGRDFETKEYLDDIVDESYRKLDKGIQNFINEYKLCSIYYGNKRCRIYFSQIVKFGYDA